jgi:hypothetical protein
VGRLLGSEKQWVAGNNQEDGHKTRPYSRECFVVRIFRFKVRIRYCAGCGKLSMKMDDFSDNSLCLWRQTAKDGTEVQMFF